MTPKATTGDIVGSWRAPVAGGIELGYFFYPDGVLILQNPRHKRFAMRGAWQLDDDGRLVISDVVDPSANRSEAERELIRSERHNISIKELSPDSMVWQNDEAGEPVAFRRAGDLPERKERISWEWLLRGGLFGN